MKWWGGGLSTLSPSCSNRDICFGSIAFKFEPLGTRFRVFVLANQGRKPYDAYNNRLRYPNDLRVKSTEGMWVDVNGARFSFQGVFTWACVLTSIMRIDCSLRARDGASYPFTAQPLPPGRSPTTWPDPQ